MAKAKNNKNIIIYQAKDGAIELRGDFKKDTIWGNLNQIAALFERDKSVISRHINRILADKELDRKSTVAKNATVQMEGNREVIREIEYYNLDMIISVGYRVNSKKATEFRKWATKILKEHITKGYSINKKQILKNYDEFINTVNNIQSLLPEHVKIDPKIVLDLVKEFAATWSMLDAYDKDVLEQKGLSKRRVKLTGEELRDAISSLRDDLIKKGEATELFAQEKGKGSVESIVANVFQTFGGKAVYNTNEEKAAHLLYFMVKNHPFNDGNKRSGAFSFVWFLRKARLRGARNINPGTLTALTLLIAESKPSRKNQMTALVSNLLLMKK